MTVNMDFATPHFTYFVFGTGITDNTLFISLQMTQSYKLFIRKLFYLSNALLE